LIIYLRPGHVQRKQAKHSASTKHHQRTAQNSADCLGEHDDEINDVEIDGFQMDYNYKSELHEMELLTISGESKQKKEEP